MSPRVCPHCGMGAEGTTNIDRDDSARTVEELADADQAVIVCLYCSGLSFIEPDGSTRKPNPAEARELSREPVILAAVAAVDYRRATRPWPVKVQMESGTCPAGHVLDDDGGDSWPYCRICDWCPDCPHPDRAWHPAYGPRHE